MKRFRKNYVTSVPLYLILLLWHTGKFALIQTFKYAPRLGFMQCQPIRNVKKPLNKVRDVAYKVVRKSSQLKQTNYKNICFVYCNLKLLCWKQFHRILYRFPQRNWWKKYAKVKLPSCNANNGKLSIKDGYKCVCRSVKKVPSLTDQKLLKSLHYSIKLRLYRHLPWRAISRLWGQLNSIELPRCFRKPAYSFYIWVFNCRAEEGIIQDLSQYRNLSEYFRRLLKPGVRLIDFESALTSPADGKVLYCSQVKNGVLEQVKGVTYSLEQFLGLSSNEFDIHPQKIKFSPDGKDNLVLDQIKSYETKEKHIHKTIRRMNSTTKTTNLLSNPSLNELFYCVIYLSPGDYHRFHSPTNWNVQKRRHFPGELFSVNPSVAKWLKGLFNMNERAVYFGQWVHGFFSMTLVGATNVGSISVYIDKKLKTNVPKSSKNGCYIEKHFDKECTKTKHIENESTESSSSDYDSFSSSDSSEKCSSFDSDDEIKSNKHGIFLKKGKLFGEFNFGSTIVLLFEAPKSFTFSIVPGQKVKYGQALSCP